MPTTVSTRSSSCCCHSALPLDGWPGGKLAPLPVRLQTLMLQATGESWKGLSARLLSARKFARVNALALRKISKKHDKVLGSRAGHQFLQVRHGGSCCLATPPLVCATWESCQYVYRPCCWLPL